MEVWQSPVYCYSLENCRFRKGPVSSNLTASTIIGDVAHQVEQQTENLCVVGSSPTVATKASPLLTAYNRTNS